MKQIIITRIIVAVIVIIIISFNFRKFRLVRFLYMFTSFSLYDKIVFPIHLNRFLYTKTTFSL